MAEARGVEIFRSDDGSILIFAGLFDGWGNRITTGTASLRLWHLETTTGALETYDFDDDTFKAGAITTPTTSMTFQAAETGGAWVLRHTALSDFLVGEKYIAEISHSSLWHEWTFGFQYGGNEGDLNEEAEVGVGEVAARSILLQLGGVIIVRR